jgi:hypothetical protein
MSNLLPKVETHAARLEAAADKMENDGIGGHATRGHAAVLRDMAGCMRADAARGKMPDVYNGGGAMFGAAATDNAPKARPLLTPLQASQAKNGANKDLLRSVMARAQRLGFTINLDDKHVDVVALDAAMAGKDVSERLAIKATLAKMGLIA